MGKPLLTLALMSVLACGPEAGEENDIPGKLEYEQLHERLYRLDRRIDVRFETENGEHWECGMLTDRAYDELEGTLDALDRDVDYGNHAADCHTYGALIHVEGFAHSPFECTFECCHPDLIRAAVVYTMILNNFWGGYPTIEGEPYVAIEPDVACP